jgi:hypothetical protein
MARSSASNARRHQTKVSSDFHGKELVWQKLQKKI